MAGDSNFFSDKGSNSPWGPTDNLPPAIDTHGGTGIPALDRLPTYQAPAPNSAADKILGNFHLGGFEQKPQTNAPAEQSPFGSFGGVIGKIGSYLKGHCPSDCADDADSIIKGALVPFGKIISNVRFSPKDTDGFDRMEADLSKSFTVADIGNGISIKAGDKFGFSSKDCDGFLSVKDIKGLQIMSGDKVVGDVQTGRLMNDDGKSILKANVKLPNGQRQVVDIPLSDAMIAAAKSIQ